MDAAALALRLVAPHADQEALLADHPHQLTVALAEALKDRYVAVVSSEPPKAAAAASALTLLAQRSAAPEIHALRDWTRGMAILQLEGRPEAAIGLIDAAAAQFTALGKPSTAAATQTSKVYALALLGRYDEALLTGERARDLLLLHHDPLAAAKVEQNLGNIHHRRGNLQAATTWYSAAREHFAAAGDLRLLAFAENGLANVLALQHQSPRARALYEQALAHAAAAGAAVTEAEIACNLGCLALSLGRYAEALAYLDRSRQRYAALAMPHETAISELELLDAYLELNLASDAAAIASRLTAQLTILGMQAEQARALTSHSLACVALGTFAEARQLALAARRLYDREDNALGVATTTLIEAQIDYAEGAAAAALTAAAAAEQVFGAVGIEVYRLLAGWLKGEAARMLGDQAAAQETLTTVLAASQLHELPQIAHRCQTSLGLLAASTDPQAAERHFKAAVTTIETLWAPLLAEDFRVGFIADKITPYLELVRICLAAEPAARLTEALDYVEAARSRVLLDRLRGAPDQALTPDSDNATLTSLRQAREELNWYYSQIRRLADSEAPPDPATVSAWQRAAAEREALIQDLSRQLHTSGSASGGRSVPLALDDLQRVLGPATALIEYFSLDGQLLAFVVTDRGIVAVEPIASETEIAAALAQFRFQLGALRHGGGLHQTHASQLGQRATRHLQQLYTLLLRPLERAIGDRNLIIVPHGALHYIPFHALHDGLAYVIARREVSYAPSAQTLLHVAARPPQPLRAALLLGAHDAYVPQLRAEVETIAPLFAAATALTGEQATVAALQQGVASCDVLHLACHGQFRPDNPLFSALLLADGRLTVRDVYELRLRCQLAVLSACDTGVSSVAPGDEILGIARGFFAAGVPTLIVSLWAADDASTSALMVQFYQLLLAGQRPTTALRLAQLRALETEAHPFFWAPFIVLGRP